mgnify:CR=1 FL=1
MPRQHQESELAMQHWTLARDADGIARLTLDRAGASTNTLGAPVLAEFNEALDQLDRDPPRGLVIASGKASGFIAGADVDEFKAIGDESAALAHREARLGHLRAPRRGAAIRRWRSIRGFCLGGGLELALACRYRVVVDEPGTRLGLPEVMLGIVPGWGGMKRLPRLAGAPAALDLMLTGRTIDARRAKRIGVADECVPARIMENTARGILKALPPPRRLGFPLSLTLNPLVRRDHRRAGAKAGREARAARALSRAVRDPRHLGEIRRQRARRAGRPIRRRSRRSSRRRPPPT